MRIQLPFILFMLLDLACRGQGQPALGLAPWFGDGMVLQRSPNTLLQGFGPPGKTLTISFWSGSWDTSHWTVRVDASGQWKTNVDLSPSKFQNSNKHWSLQIDEEEKKSFWSLSGGAGKGKNGAHLYQNILIGDVIIVAGWENQRLSAGIPAFISGPSAKQLDRNTNAIRFVDLTHANLVENLKQASGAEWENWPVHATDLDRYSTLALRLAYELAEHRIPKIATEHYAGIVLASRPIVEDALKTPNQVEPLDTTICNWIADDALQAQTNRSWKLVQNKRHNIVSNLPPIVAYDPAQLASWEAFDSNKPPGDLFSFAGAVWSAPRPKQEP